MELTEWYGELDLAENIVLNRALSALSNAGMSQTGLDYVKVMRGYPRTPYYMALWIMDPLVRKEVGTAICIHAIGCKLIDDLIDDDQKMSRQDLVLGIYLLQVAEAALSHYHYPSEVFGLFERDYQEFWRFEVRDPQASPISMADWLAKRRITAGKFLSTYAEAACIAGNVRPSIRSARAFAEAFGLLYMLGDDWTDYTESGQKAGNLAYLLQKGKVPLDEVIDTIRILQASAKDSIKSGGPICCDITPKIDHFANKVTSLFQQLSSEYIQLT